MCDPFLHHNLISVCTFATRLPQRHGFLFDDCDKEQFVFMTVRLNSWCFLYTPLPCFSFVPLLHSFTFSLFTFHLFISSSIFLCFASSSSSLSLSPLRIPFPHFCSSVSLSSPPPTIPPCFLSSFPLLFSCLFNPHVPFSFF